MSNNTGWLDGSMDVRHVHKAKIEDSSGNIKLVAKTQTIFPVRSRKLNDPVSPLEGFTASTALD